MIGTIIKENMEAANLSSKDVTLLLGVSPKYLSEIVNGHKVPSYEMSILFDKLFGFKQGEIFNYGIKYDEIKNLNENKQVKRIYENTFKKLERFKTTSKLSVFKRIIDSFPTKDIDLYKKYLMVKSVDFFKYKDEPSAYLWTSLMENKYGNKKTSVSFNKARAEATLDKSLDILFSKENFNKKVKLLETFLESRGVVLANSPFLPGSNVNGVTIKRGNQNFIFMNDKQKREHQYIFAFVHEFMHLYTNHNEDNNIIVQRIKKYMDKTGNEHKELNMAFETFESTAENKWELLRIKTKQKISFGNIEDFIIS